MLSSDLAALHRDVLTRFPTDDSILGLSSVTPEWSSALNPSNYALAPHNHLPINKVNKSHALNMYLMVHRTFLESPGYFWLLQVGINYLADHDAKTTMLLGLMDILPNAIDGFELHLLNEKLILPCLTKNRVGDGFP